jgi:uridine kinase
MIITIDGVAGAGKTTLAKKLTSEFEGRHSVQVIHMDDLYDGWENPFGKALSQKLKMIARAHLSGKPFRTTLYDWQKSQPGPDFLIPPCEILIVEGVGSGQRAMRKQVATKVWIEFEPALGLQRVLARDGELIESQMRGFLTDQDEHLRKEGTREAADFHLNGAG